MAMEIFNRIEANFKELTSEEAKLVNGGEPTRSTSFIYDAFYTVSHLFTHGAKALVSTGVFTYQFWVEWDEAIL